MDIGELICIKTLEDEANIFGKDEKHTSYRAEIRLFSCVQQGDIENLMNELKGIDSTITMGRMSDDDLMQYKYMAVSAITLATRYAIQGGLNEKTAYDFSDRVIMSVDRLETKGEILLCLATEIAKLTKMVSRSKAHPSHSPYVKKCICYINENITEKLSVSGLSEYCGITADYLSKIFKDEIGENLSSYIVRKKLDVAKNLIMQQKNSKEICEILGFSSPSHFITLFKKYYKLTPSEYYKFVK